MGRGLGEQGQAVSSSAFLVEHQCRVASVLRQRDCRRLGAWCATVRGGNTYGRTNKAFGAVQAEGCAVEGTDHACRVLYCKQTGAERMGDLARNQHRSISR